MDQIRKLLHAAEQGNVCMASELLDGGVHVDSTDDEGVSALHTAAANGHDNMVRLLLSRGASFDARNSYGWTPLMTAACYGHVKIVVILIQYKADIFAQNDLGATALDSAARSGHLQVVGLLIDASSDCQWQCLSDNCLTALLNACHHGHEHVVKLLLDKRTDVNYKDSITGWTPLMFASLNGHISVVQLLCEYGADADSMNILHQTALDIAARRQRTDVAAYLDRKTTKRPQLTGQKTLRPSIIEAARSGDLQGVRELLEIDETEVNTADEDGATSLMFAAMCGHHNVAELLLDKGADIDSQDRISGWTALMQATYYSHKHIVKLLLDHSADVNVRAEEGYTAFDMATIIGDTEIVRLLASVTMQLPGNHKNGNGRLISWSDNMSKNEPIGTSSRDFSSKEIAKCEVQDIGKSGLRTWWSKMSSRLKNLTLIRTIRVSSVDIDNKKSIAKDFSSNSSTSATEDLLQSSGSAKSLVSVVDSALKAGGHHSKRSKTLPLGSPVSRLPDDVISPVVPPSMPTPSFELTQIKVEHGEDEDTVPRLSSVSGYSAYHRSMVGINGSPESSFSTGSHFSSNTSGSRTLKAASPSSDIPGKTLVTLRNKPATRPMQSPSPTLISVKSAASAPTRLHPSLLNKSSKHMSGSRSDDGISCRTHRRISENTEKDEVADILKKLSLEKYNSMFEEQEVDMEAFLTLNEVDLKFLGVTHKDARQQILSAIKELNVGKDRERQQFKESISEGNHSKSPLTSGYGSASPSSSTNFSRWAVNSGFKPSR
ncbi:ankyrin repeat and SAM domain-containing protein 6 isoform X2 [Exaiptasia diaphana]|uniref:NAD(+) ADP-ribosyltransferase n=1 Tax=Exaiptasia diaphana TaxID=2652724 RepID=A0A913WRG5_EXADI|nr:ankyrin repeat and SAM domain-containing protein 6 isoform X2 [Exaiptasia diaphana]